MRCDTTTSGRLHMHSCSSGRFNVQPLPNPCVRVRAAIDTHEQQPWSRLPNQRAQMHHTDMKTRRRWCALVRMRMILYLAVKTCKALQCLLGLLSCGCRTATLHCACATPQPPRTAITVCLSVVNILMPDVLCAPRQLHAPQLS